MPMHSKSALMMLQYERQASKPFASFAHLVGTYMVPCHMCKSLRLEHDPLQRVSMLQQHLAEHEHEHLCHECTDVDTHMLHSLPGITDNL